MQPTNDDTSFLNSLWAYYDANGRHELPWRLAEPSGDFDPYKILVSELMLQQTQVGRVIPKFLAFMETFPTVERLAAASLGEVLTAWSGLGYNRRAKFLHQAAQRIIADGGQFPDTLPGLVALPGVGPNTAGAILAYAFNKPAVFIETNVRTVYIHHYFADQVEIPDAKLTPIVERTLDSQQPRLFYWALMDYGSHLKQQVGNLNKLSKHYTKQSTFAGSQRQIRGQVIRLLTQQPQKRTDLVTAIEDSRLVTVLDDLVAEGLIKHVNSTYRLA
jgi:A/G-specific adenine glycosylase